MMPPHLPAALIDPQHRQRLVDSVQTILSASSTPGASVALFVDGQPLLVTGVGRRDPASPTLLGAADQFYIYSITKLLIATAILQLVGQARLELDAPIQRYLADLPLPAPLTLRQLLNHTAGLPDYGGLPAYSAALRADPGRPWSVEEYLAQTLAGGLLFEPGQGWAYSNIGYLLLRLLLEQLSDAPLAVVLRRQLFEPLGLQQTFGARTLDDAQALTPGYSTYFSSDDRLQDIRLRYHPGWVSHGVVVSTAAELARIVEALFSGQLVPPALLAAMLEPVLLSITHPLFRQPAYGLGLMIDAQGRYGLVAGHAGGGPGYATAALHCAAVAGRRVTSVALANRDQSDLGLRIAYALIDTFAAASSG